MQNAEMEPANLLLSLPRHASATDTDPWIVRPL